MITFNEQQEENSQTCGGYSLAAVLVEMRKTDGLPDKDRGEFIYKMIQDLQKASSSKGEIKNQLLQVIVKQGQSLPSFICKVAGLYKLNMGVYYSQNTLCKAFTIHILSPDAAKIACEAITEEKGRIGDAIVTDIDEKTIISDIGSESRAYYIVLVNNATHWVVVQKEKEKFYMYDPATGVVSITPSLDLKTNTFSGMYIKIC